MEKELPKNWVEGELNQIFSYVIGGDWGKDILLDDTDYVEALCIRGSEIKNWNRDKGSTASLRKIKKSSLNSRKLEFGDILLEISGGGPDQPVGRTVIVDDEVLNYEKETEKVCTNFLRLVRVDKKLNSFYVNHYLQYFYHSGEIVKYQGGSNNLRNLKYKEFETITLPLPPLAEQNRIVAKLDSLFAQLESIKTSMAKIPVLLKNFRQQVLTQAVTGKLTDEWREGKNLEEWKIDILKNLATKMGSGSTPRGGSNSYISEGIPLVRSMNVVFGGIKIKGLAFISELQANALKNVEIQFEDILLNLTGASIGRLCLADKRVTGGRVNQHVFIIRSKSELILSKYLEIYLSSNLIQRFIDEKKYGGGMEAISKTQIENFEINFPPLNEQQEIVSRVESLFAKADAIEEKYKNLKAKIETLPQTILHKAFKGELTEQLETDGDARVLLEEIVALKAEKK